MIIRYVLIIFIVLIGTYSVVDDKLDNATILLLCLIIAVGVLFVDLYYPVVIY